MRTRSKWVERGHGVLVDHGDLGAPDLLQALFVEFAEVFAGEVDLAPEQPERWVREEAQHRQHGEGLARAALAYDPELLAGKDLEVDATDDLGCVPMLANTYGDVTQRQQGLFDEGGTGHLGRRHIERRQFWPCHIRPWQPGPWHRGPRHLGRSQLGWQSFERRRA